MNIEFTSKFNIQGLTPIVIKDFLTKGFILKELSCEDVILCFEKSKVSNIHIVMPQLSGVNYSFSVIPAKLVPLKKGSRNP